MKSSVPFFARREVEQGEDVRLRLIRDGSPELARLRTDRGLGGSNRLGAAINRAYLEFTFKAEYAYDYGMPQWVAEVDHAFAPLPFGAPLDGPSQALPFSVVVPDDSCKLCAGDAAGPADAGASVSGTSGVEAVVRGHLKGNRNYTTEIHRLLSLELLHRLFVDAQKLVRARSAISIGQNAFASRISSKSHFRTET